MANAGDSATPPSPPSVFLSYASEDRPAARLVRDTLAAAGVEVWYDENELGGGDAWDQKIRRQIRECDYFMPLISAHTEARPEGYFRREWRFAVERTLDMADDHMFLLPVVIDQTNQAAARVPDRFGTVQWLKVPNGVVTPALSALCARLAAGHAPVLPAPKRLAVRAKPAALEMPPFPTAEAGQRVKFWVEAAVWAVKSAWIRYKRLPRIVRYIIVLWLIFVVYPRGCAHVRVNTPTISPQAAAKLKAIAAQYQDGKSKEDIAKLGVAIAREFADEADEDQSDRRPLLAIPFASPANHPAEAKLANSAFALLYGHLAISRPHDVGLSKETLPTLDLNAARERGRQGRAQYVILGGIEERTAAPVLTVEIVSVADGAVIWSQSYPAATADPEAIATETESHVPALDSK